MKILMFYEHIARELKGCERVETLLKDMTNAQICKYSIFFEYFKAVKYSKHNKIDILIMPWLYSEKDYQLVMPFIKENKKIYIINLHHEQIGSVISDPQVIPGSENSKNSVIHFVWSEYFKNLLIDAGVNENLIFVTGNIRAEVSMQNTNRVAMREEFAQIYKLDLKKKWIIYCENRDWVWERKNNLIKMYMQCGCSKKDAQSFFEESLKSIKRTILDINGQDDNFYNKYELIYRGHPGISKNLKFDDRVKFISDQSVSEWFKVVDANIVSGSTTIFESEAMGIPSFLDYSYKMNHRFQTYGVESYPKLKSIGDIDLDNYEAKFKNIYEQYIGIIDGKVAFRIARVIINIYDYGLPQYEKGVISTSRVKFLLKFIREKLMNVFISSHLLELLKFPKIAYQMKNDFPPKSEKYLEMK